MVSSPVTFILNFGSFALSSLLLVLLLAINKCESLATSFMLCLQFTSYIALNKKTFMGVNGIGHISRFHCIMNYGTQNFHGINFYCKRGY